MKKSAETIFRTITKVALLALSSYVTVVSIMVLAYLLSIPLAWLSAILNMSKRAFLILSAVPVFLSIYVIQHHRFGERALEAVLASVFKYEVSISQIQEVRAVRRSWREIRQLAEERAADWIKLYGLVRRAEQEVSRFNLATTEQIKIFRELAHWATAPGTISASKSKVSQMIERGHTLQTQIDHALDNIYDYNDQIVGGAKSLLEKAIRGKLREIEWDTLRSRLRNAEKSLTPTLWTLIESSWRRQRLKAYRRSYERKRRRVIEWLEEPFDESPILKIRSKLLGPLKDGRTIRCPDGEIRLTLKELKGKQQTTTYLGPETIDRLRDL